MTKLSLLLPVYRNDDPDHLEEAITSVTTQTRLPEELVIVQDGPIPQSVDNIIERWQHNSDIIIRRVLLENNSGLGTALRVGMQHCKGEYVARMDADDIAVPFRLEKQVEYLNENPNIDIVGGFISEFEEDADETLALRKVPTDHNNIAEMARFRSPFNHGTVVMRREAVISAGNYRSVDRMEDWDLWSRMLQKGATGANLPEVLLNVRAGDKLYKRRGGWEYTREEIRQQLDFFRRGFITLPQFLRNMALRVPLRFVPNSLRAVIYKRFGRFQNEVTDS